VCRHIDFDSGAAWAVCCQAQVRRIAENQPQPLAERRQPGAEAVRRLMEPNTGVGDAYHAAFTNPRDVDVDPASFFAGVYSVSHRILDQGQ
jgi:hypothetical protein